MAEFVTLCDARGAVTQIWGAVRQVHIGKGKPLAEDQTLTADSLRPICVTSMWWRVPGKARFGQPQAQAWMRQILPDYVFGGVPKRGTGDAIAWMLHSVRRRPSIWQRPFDHVHPTHVCLSHLLAPWRAPCSCSTLSRSLEQSNEISSVHGSHRPPRRTG